MQDCERLQKILKAYKELYLNIDGDFKDDYNWGLFNGLEIALAVIEDRPAFMIKKDKSYSKYDLEKNAEYFL